ncbi:MAG: ABC transporter permease [Erysipelotrichaceae bacterium]|nr:ABC transporter permease [Erysipelotrichaceae bacterium]
MKPTEYNVNIPKEKFTLVNENKVLHDKELVTKPVGFFKDAMYRFSRNKGSIVGAAVVGVLILYALVAPIFSPYTVSYNDAFYRYTLPKLFNNIDFLDGAADKTLNEESLLYYYSMGVETGHNAIKRQEYTKNEATGMYKFRLDSYHSPGTIFIGAMSEKEYVSLQEYQDKTNRQVIYPITELSKRPVQAQDRNNANYWFATEVKASKTVAKDYVIEEDGTISYSNIYLPYSIPRLLTTKVETFIPDTFAMAVELEDGKFAFNLAKKGADGQFQLTPSYISVGRNAEDTDFLLYSHELETAATFILDSTNSVLVINLTGHEDETKDGDYYLALPEVQGSALSLRPYDDVENVNFVPLKVLNRDTGAYVTGLDDEGLYCLSFVKDRSKTAKSYISSLVRILDSTNGFSVSSASNNASYVSFGTKNDGYTISFYNRSQPNVKTNLLVTVNPDGTFTLGTGTLANATVFKYDDEKNALYTDITTMPNPANNGAYYLASLLPQDPTLLGTVNNTNYKVILATAEQIDSSEYRDYYRVLDTSIQPVTEIDTTSEYMLCANKIFPDMNYFYLNGNVDGDNYFSSMRIEGEGEYLYSYAYQKGDKTYEVRVNYYEYYRYYHQVVLKDRISEPLFLFGTTSYGQDIFTCLASGARFSFMLAIIVAFVNMLVGAIYGAIEGYYGGKIDLVMERIVEILSAVPFMIVITLLRYHMANTSQALILFIAFFLTGWIGMSSLVRMQFYRFKNQEYVLASRTLGARDWRIMFKHIFPNALGTIVTSSVLVIPGMIFSETSLSYLGIINLSTGDVTSVGTLLANAQPYLVSYPHMIFFPAIFISLLMLCFNLFGNGLRDAFNPSLRGTED